MWPKSKLARELASTQWAVLSASAQVDLEATESDATTSTSALKTLDFVRVLTKAFASTLLVDLSARLFSVRLGTTKL